MRREKAEQVELLRHALLGAVLIAALFPAGPADAAPEIAPGATAVSVSPVNRHGLDTTVFSTDFIDTTAAGVDSFRVTLTIREPDDVTELVLVSDRAHGSGGLTITDHGGGSFTASYSYEPVDTQALGLYDLRCAVSRGTETAVDSFAVNLDELEIVHEVPNLSPGIEPGAARSNPVALNRAEGDSTVLSAAFSDLDYPAVGAFTVSFRVREPDDATELVLADGLAHGAGGVTIVENNGSYIARLTWTPGPAQALGLYDLFFSVSDGTDTATDGYASNADELELGVVSVNHAPTIASGATGVSPGSVTRAGAATTQFQVGFTDVDEPVVGDFAVTFLAREPHHAGVVTVADALAHGVGGMNITDNGSGSYTAQMLWDPSADALVGDYDLQAVVSDGEFEAEDLFDANPDELTVTNTGENAPPVVAADETWAAPAAVERVGANLTTLSADFSDSDLPGVGAFTVSFKLRLPDNATELVLADATIADQGGGVYRASLAWDPPDAQEAGFYDLYFQVSDGTAASTDGFADNLDELEVYDALTNQAPTLVAGTTAALPDSITRIGAEYTMLSAVFTDLDYPGVGGFTVTFKVRDPVAGETLVADAAGHGEQGVRIVHQGAGAYQAAVLWDPPVGQVPGGHDLHFQVWDDGGGTVVDDYANNPAELNVTAALPAGDGYLLHRSADAASCGGPNAACHDLEDHQSQDCRVCHTPHGSTNIFLVPETIQTPNSGPKPVVFKTLGIGDPDNDPDPTVGDPTSGVMGDDSDGVHTGVCEVCHTSTAHHRNDGTAPGADHYNAENCVACHNHGGGFEGGESAGGMGCTCHAPIYTAMSTADGSYHHILTSDLPDYSGKTCLMCHVDHDIFRPDLNPGIGQRGSNLKSSWDATVVQGNATVLANSGYIPGGGLCMSCHAGNCTACHTLHSPGKNLPESSATAFDHVFLVQADYDAATSAHNYNVPTTFSADGSVFNANCVKCHSDEMIKSYQDGPNEFSLHDTRFPHLLAPMGAGSPADSLEESFCFQCHSSTTNPNAGSSRDYFDAADMTNADALEIEDVFTGRTYTHPTTTYSGRHSPAEGPADLADGNRHAECADCHNPHAARQGTHDGSSNLVSNALKGTWGVEPTAWPAMPIPTDNANLFAAPAGFTKVSPAQREYQICFKCHSNYTTLPTGSRNLAAEINPNYPSTHGIAQAGTNIYCDDNTMLEPWASSGITWCSDCHRSSVSTDPEGPHGSNLEHLLVASITSSNSAGTPLCFVCHKQTVYWSSSDAAEWSGCSDHPSKIPQHKGRQKGCFACHMWDYGTRTDIGVNNVNNLDTGDIYVHGQNKHWIYNERSGAGSGHPSQGFLNAYVANADFTTRTCWSESCHIHSNGWDPGEYR